MPSDVPFGDDGERLECAEMRRRFELEPMAGALLPALPYVREAYTRTPVPVALYRVRARLTDRPPTDLPSPSR